MYSLLFNNHPAAAPTRFPGLSMLQPPFLALALLKAGVLLVDHVKSSLTANDLAIGASFLDRCSNFHGLKALGYGKADSCVYIIYSGR
jgi:hypothetical protein